MGVRTCCVFLLLAACDAGTAPPAAPALVSTSLDGASDRVSPSAPIDLIFSQPLDDGAGDAIAVVAGLADGPPDPDEPRRVPGRVTVDGAAARWQPLRPLAPDALHTLVVAGDLTAGGVRLGRPSTRAFTTGPSTAGAPWWSLADPPAGSAAVVRNLRAVHVVFSRRVDGVDAGTLILVGGDGAPVAATVAEEACAGCFRIDLGATLAPRTFYQVVARAPIVDDDGEPPFDLAAPPGFTTGDAARAEPPGFYDLALAASSGCLVARFRTDVPAAATLCVDADCVAESDRRALHELARPLAAGGGAGVTLAARDESTAPAGALGPLDAPPSSPRTLTITEVLTHPRGARLAQQFVEVRNRGGAPVALDGLLLADELGASAVPAATLPPGGYALIVPQGFVADDGLDAPPAGGTPILRVAASHLGGNGLRESGEAIALTEPDGRAVSRFSTYGLALAAGQSATRAAACDVAGAYRATDGGGATPGGP